MELFWSYFGVIRELLGRYFGVILELLGRYFGVILELLGRYFGVILELLGRYFGVIGELGFCSCVFYDAFDIAIEEGAGLVDGSIEGIVGSVVYITNIP